MRKALGSFGVLLLAGSLGACTNSDSDLSFMTGKECEDYAKTLIRERYEGASDDRTVLFRGEDFAKCVVDRVYEFSNGRFLAIEDKEKRFKLIDTSLGRSSDI